MDLPDFAFVDTCFEDDDPWQFYMTEQHQQCADWKVKVMDYGPGTVLDVHSQYLAGASPIFAGMVAEKVNCDTPIYLGPFSFGAALAALRFVYRLNDVNAYSVSILLEEGLLVDVLGLGHKFDFSFYEPLLEILTPHFLSTVPQPYVIRAAINAFKEGNTRLQPLFLTATCDIMVDLQKSGDGGAIDDAVKLLSESPTLLQAALSSSLKALSLSNPRAMYAVCGKANDAWECLDAPEAFFSYSFCWSKPLGGPSPVIVSSPTFEFEGHSFRLKVKLDNAVENRGGKHVGLFLQFVDSVEEVEAVTICAELRVVNLRSPSLSWEGEMGHPEFSKAHSTCGFTDLAPQDQALLPTASGHMGTVQVVSMEKIQG